MHTNSQLYSLSFGVSRDDSTEVTSKVELKNRSTVHVVVIAFFSQWLISSHSQSFILIIIGRVKLNVAPFPSALFSAHIFPP
jgi:hypothetical protein